MKEYTGRRLFYVVLIIITAAHLVLIASTRLYPFTDIPNHLAAATIYKFYGESSNQFSEYFSLNPGLKPNVFHLLFCSLKIFPSVELANRLLLCLYVILLPFSTLIVIRKLGGNHWFSLLSFLLVYNYNLSWGFIGFTLSIPFILIFLYYSIILVEGKRPGIILVVAGLPLLIFFIHALAAVFSLFLLLVYCLLACRSPLRNFLSKTVAIVPGAALLAAWWMGQDHGSHGEGMSSFLLDYYGQDFIGTFTRRKSFFILDNFHLFNKTRGEAVAALFSLCIIVPAIWMVLHRLRSRKSPDTRRMSPALSLFAAASLCYILLPQEIPRQAILYQRFSVLVLLSLILIAGIAAGKSLRYHAITGIIVAACLHLSLWAGYFIDFNRENAGFTREFLPEARRGAVLSGLLKKYTYRGKPIYIHFPSYYITWRKGVACTKLIDYRFGTVRRKVDAGKLPVYFEWAGRFKFYDGRYWNAEYMLFRGKLPGNIMEAFKDFEHIKTTGDWSLHSSGRI